MFVFVYYRAIKWLIFLQQFRESVLGKNFHARDYVTLRYDKWLVYTLFDQSFIKLAIAYYIANALRDIHAEKCEIAFVMKHEFSFPIHNRVTFIAPQFQWPLLQPCNIPKIFFDDRRKRTKVRFTYTSVRRTDRILSRAFQASPRSDFFRQLCKVQRGCNTQAPDTFGILWLI